MLDVIGRDESVQHIVASFQTDVFSGVRTDRAGEGYTISNYLLTPADFMTNLYNR